jgi:predicted GH43/DUF377 family glycosyl hydrolase
MFRRGVGQAFQPAGDPDFPVRGSERPARGRFVAQVTAGRVRRLFAIPGFNSRVVTVTVVITLAATAGSRAQPLAITNAAAIVDPATMQRIYDEVKTPFKYGIVLRGETNQLVDCPSILREGKQWFMMYVANSGKVGYETFLARSDDLLRWTKLGKILSFTKTGWDAWQADGGLALVNSDWEGDHALGKFDGKYWLSYIGGALKGYETDPLSIGMAWTETPTEAREWQRVPQNPVLGPKDADAREFERKTLYKSTIIRDTTASLGAPFVMFYNAKVKNGYERIGMALSTNLVHWTRLGTNCVVANGEAKRNGITGDPQLVRMGDVWVMFYFGAGWKPKAFDTFAVSRDLVNWTQWEGPHLVEPSEPWDATYAHKPWVLKHDGVVYHFYCAVGNEGRVIALATSKDLRAREK